MVLFFYKIRNIVFLTFFRATVKIRLNLTSKIAKKTMFSVNYHQGTSLLLKSLNSPYCLISLVFKIFHLSFFFFVPKLCLSTFSAIVTLTISIIHPPNTTLKTSNLVSLCCVLSDIHSLIWQKIYVPFKAQSIRHFLVITSIITRSSLYFHSKYCIHTLIMLFNS